MMYFLGWIIFCFVAGFVGSDRKIGFWGAFFLSLFLSPLVGLIVAFASKNNAEIRYQEEFLKTQKQQQIALEQMAQSSEIEQLFNLMKKGILTQEEFNQKKKTLLGLNNSIVEEAIGIEDHSLNGTYNFDSNLLATLKQIKNHQDKDILLDTILQYLKTYSIPAEIQRNHPKIVEAIISNKFNLKPIEAIFSIYKAQPAELANIEKQMKEFIK